MARPTPTIRDWLPRSILVLIGAAAFATSSPEVIDTVSVEVNGHDTIAGSLRPSTERESFLIDVPRGATLRASAKSTSAGGATPAIDVLDPDLSVIAASPAAKTVKAPRVTTARSGMHRVRVCGDGESDGEYQLKVRAKLPKSWSEAGDVELAAGAEAQVEFGAGAGAIAKVTLSRVGQSELAPQFLEVTGPDAFSFPIAAPERSGKRHVVKNILLPSTGDYSVRFKNAGADAGRWKLKVALANVNPRKRALDLSDDELAGEFAGEQVVFARFVDADGGVVDPPDSDSVLGGVSILVPRGAITAPTLIVISESEPFFVDDDVSEGGATFDFGPSGLSFTEPAQVTIPYDAQAYDDPSTEVSVVLRDETTGEVETVTGTVDLIAGTITFAAPHFSRFQAASPRPRPLAGEYVELELAGVLDAGFASSVRFGLNEVRGGAGPRTGNSVVRTLNRFEVRTAPDPQRGGVIEGIRDQRTQMGTISAGATVDFDLGSESIAFLRGRSPDILLRRAVDTDRATVSLLMRRVRGKPTRGALAGDWEVIVLEHSAIRGSDGAIAVSSTGQTFRLVVDAKGKAVASGVRRAITSVPLSNGAPRTLLDKQRPPNGSLVPAGPFARFQMEVGHRTVIDTVDLHPVVRGDALVGVTGEVLGNPNDPTLLVTRVVILARVGSGGSNADLGGRSRFAGFDLGVLPSGSTSPVAGARFDALALDVEHNGVGMFRARGFGSTITRGPAGDAVRTQRQLDFVSSYRVAKDLSYSEDVPFDGGVLLVRRGLYISTLFRDGRVALGFGLPSRPLEE